jgi:hypothetical protein
VCYRDWGLWTVLEIGVKGLGNLGCSSLARTCHELVRGRPKPPRGRSLIYDHESRSRDRVLIGSPQARLISFFNSPLCHSAWIRNPAKAPNKLGVRFANEMKPDCTPVRTSCGVYISSKAECPLIYLLSPVCISFFFGACY